MRSYQQDAHCDILTPHVLRRHCPAVTEGFCFKTPRKNGARGKESCGSVSKGGSIVKADELRSIQAPLKDRYRHTPEAALITLRAQGRLADGVSCKVETGKAPVVAGLH